jgi:uncharacterized cupin superfamily protein
MTKVLLHGADSGERLGLVEMPVEAGFGGPPLHTHELWDEGFYVLEGEVTIQTADDVVTATPGMFAFAPRGVAHTFSNRTNTDARILVLFTPAGFERYLAGEIAREDVPVLIAQRTPRTDESRHRESS